MRLLGQGSPIARRYTEQHKQKRTRINIQAPSGIRKHDTSVRAVEDITQLRPDGHCDGRLKFYTKKKHIL
jgi:hypothetical protein